MKGIGPYCIVSSLSTEVLPVPYHRVRLAVKIDEALIARVYQCQMRPTSLIFCPVVSGDGMLSKAERLPLTPLPLPEFQQYDALFH